MNLIFKTGITLAAGIFMCTGAYAQSSATASADALAKVIKPLSVQKMADMNFGRIVQNASLGTVKLGTDGAVTPSIDGLTYGGATAGAVPAAAEFSVGGEAGYGYSITLPATVTLTSLNLATPATMTATGFMVAVGADAATASPGTATLNDSGVGTFTVGATLAVGANQAVDDYRGTFNVTVNYN